MLSKLYEEERYKLQTTQAKLTTAETKITTLEIELDNLKSNKAVARQPQGKSSNDSTVLLIEQREC